MTNLVQFPGLGLSFELSRVAFKMCIRDRRMVVGVHCGYNL